MKFRRKLVSICLLIFFLCAINNSRMLVNAKENVSEQVINDMVSAIRNKNWDAFIELMCSEEKNYFYHYFSNASITKGIKQVESISLESITYVDDSIAENELLKTEYKILNYTNQIKTYLVGLNCSVSEENQYFYNGLNYFNITLAKENDNMKIVQFNKPSYSMAIKVLEKNVFKSCNTEKVAALRTLEASENGYLINMDGEPIITGIEVKKEPFKANIQSVSNNYKDHPALKKYTYYFHPDTILVCMNKVDPRHPEIVEFPFDYYIRNTLPNECILSTFKTEALLANAYCVKGVGLYHSIRPVNSAGGYDVTQYTQNFNVGTSHKISDKIFDKIDGKFIVNSNSKVFFPEYGRGTYGKKGTRASGRLLQYGSQKLANEGYTYKQILNYYYSGSSCSSGSVKVITLK